MTDPIALPGAPLPSAATSSAHAASQDPIRRVAEEFEAVFLAEMLEPMFEGLETEGLGGGGMGEEIFRPLLIEHYAAALSRAGGVGVADSIVRELVRMQQQAAAQGENDGADR